MNFHDFEDLVDLTKGDRRSIAFSGCLAKIGQFLGHKNAKVSLFCIITASNMTLYQILQILLKKAS